jgi:hypothetical protein
MNEQIFNEPGRSVNLFEALKPHIRPGVGLTDLIGIMKEQSSTPELTFHQVGDFAQWLCQEWYAAVPKQLEGIQTWTTEEYKTISQHPLTYESPGTWLKVGKQTVVVHGVFHARSSDEEDPNTEFPQVLRAYEEYTSSDGDRWFVEQGLGKYFGFTDSSFTSLHDVNNFLDTRQRLFESRSRKPVYAMGSKGQRKYIKYMTQEKYGGANTYDYLEVFDEFQRLFERYKNNFHDLVLLRYYINNFKMPEPLHMEVELALDSRKKGFGEENRHGFIHQSMLQVHEVRSLLKTPKQVNLAHTVHVLVGLAHESGDVHMLQNPSYDPMKAVVSAQQALIR